MDVLRSVMFGLLTVSLILNITEYWSASALPVATGDQSQISAKTLSTLNVLIKQARTDANRTFWDNCLKLTKRCVVFNPPTFQAGIKSTGELLQEVYNVSNNFIHLLKLFLDDITQQATVSSTLAKDLKKLNSSLLSVKIFLQQLKPDLQKVTTTAVINTSADPTLRNIKNLQIVSRLAIEMDKMSKVLP